jgi:hypothetical protein
MDHISKQKVQVIALLVSFALKSSAQSEIDAKMDLCWERSLQDSTNLS